MFLFVYGTLKSGQPRNHLIADRLTLRGHARINGQLHNWANQFPAAHLWVGNQNIHGEIWACNNEETWGEVLSELDEIEGVPFLFRHEWIEVYIDEELDQEGVPIWIEAIIYVAANPQFFETPIIEGGVWPPVEVGV